MLQDFIKSESGVTVKGYGFIVGLVSLAIFPTVVTLGATLETGYALVNDEMFRLGLDLPQGLFNSILGL